MSYYAKIKKIIRIAEEKRTNMVVTNHCRPLYAKEYNLVSDTRKKTPKVAIIIQGSLLLKKNFTVETALLYKKTFSPETIIIVSTWEHENKEAVKQLQSIGIIVLLTNKPGIAGISNINLQILSTRMGIEEAKKRGATYILKTRTDVRMYATNIEEYLLSFLKTFPLTHSLIQKERIIAFSLNTYKYRPYSVSDLTLFGHIEDIKMYFDVKEDARTIAKFTNIRSWSQERFCEVYLSTHFLEKVGRKLTYTLSDSWDVYAKHFCIVDASSIDLLWYKYSYWEEYRDLIYSHMKNNQELTFREWFILYSSKENKAIIPETILDEQFGNNITTGTKL